MGAQRQVTPLSVRGRSCRHRIEDVSCGQLGGIVDLMYKKAIAWALSLGNKENHLLLGVAKLELLEENELHSGEASL